MGSGDFGSNGSVHWNVRHTGGGQNFGTNDPIPYDNIGNGDGAGHQGTFRVRLKFPDESSAKAALANVQINGQGLVTLLVPKTQPMRPNPGGQPEVSVDW